MVVVNNGNQSKWAKISRLWLVFQHLLLDTVNTRLITIIDYHKFELHLTNLKLNDLTYD